MNITSGNLLLAGGLILPTIASVFLLPNNALALSADHLLITEISTSQGVGKTNYDFIEIHNPTNQNIDLEGYRLVKRTKSGSSDTSIKSWSSSTIIPAAGFHVWANSAYEDLKEIAHSTTTQTIADNNAVALRFGPVDTGEIIDAVAWGENASGLAEGDNFAENIPDLLSIERTAETNSNASDFQISSSLTPGALALTNDQNNDDEETQIDSDEEQTNTNTNNSSSDSEPSSGEVGNIQENPQVFINELLPNPKGPDSGYEWIELYNNSPYLIDISSWIIDDSAETTPAKNGFVVPPKITLPAFGYHAFLIPKGKFALNNTGDSIRLFNGSGSLIDSIFYTVSAKENFSFAKDINGLWHWTSIISPNAANQFDTAPTEEEEDYFQETYDYPQIIFSEILGDSQGADENNEWVEFYNPGENEFDLSGWYLDDKGKILSKNAYQFSAGAIVKPGGYFVVELSEDDFRINNNGDELRLIDPSQKTQITVIVPKLKAGASYALNKNQEWQLSMLPTPGEENKFLSDPADIRISEIYVLASENESGFIEIYNNEAKWINLAGWKLGLENDYYIFPEGASIPAKSFLAINQELLKVNINSKNYNQVKLLRPDNNLQFALNFVMPEGYKRGMSANIGENGFILSIKPTPGQENVIESIEQVSDKTIKQPNSSTRVQAPRSIPFLPPSEEGIEKDGQVAGTQAETEIQEIANQNRDAEAELPIIIQEKSNIGFFHFLKQILAKIAFWR